MFTVVCNVKMDRVKWFILNVKFALICVSKAEVRYTYGYKCITSS